MRPRDFRRNKNRLFKLFRLSLSFLQAIARVAKKLLRLAVKQLLTNQINNLLYKPNLDTLALYFRLWHSASV